MRKLGKRKQKQISNRKMIRKKYTLKAFVAAVAALMATLCSQCQVRKGVCRYRTTLLDEPLFQRVELQQHQARKQRAAHRGLQSQRVGLSPLARMMTITHTSRQFFY
jgi:hypothetical protein